MYTSKTRGLVLATTLAWGFVLAYTILPLDFVPDFIPLLGWFDDLFGVTGTLGLTAYTLKTLYDESVFSRVEAARPAPIEDGYQPIPAAELRAL